MGVRKTGAGLLLEAFKFAIFLSVPVITVGYFNRPQVLVKVIENRRYIEFPVRSEIVNCIYCAAVLV